MSLVNIRKALEKRLAAMTPALSTAYENAPYSPTVGTPYQRAFLLPVGTNTLSFCGDFWDQGIFQINLTYPKDTGTAAAYARADLIRAQFADKTVMTETSVRVVVRGTPDIAQGFVADDRFVVPVSIRFYAELV